MTTIHEIRPLTRADLEQARWHQLVEYLEAAGFTIFGIETTPNLRAVALANFDMEHP